MLDNETSWLILLTTGLEAVLGVWKIYMASKVVIKDTFPYLSIQDNDSYAQNETKEYDEIAMSYMTKAVIPILVCYSIYSFLYEEHKSIYSYILNTLV